jgi:hypothetical protein
MKERLKRFPNLLLDVSATGPDEARRRKLLNIILLGTGVLTTLVIFSLLGALIMGQGDTIDGDAWIGAIGLLLGIAFPTFFRKPFTLPVSRRSSC